MAVSEKFEAPVESTLVASVLAPTDALTGSALAGFLKVPLQLTRPATVPAAVMTEIERLGPQSVAVLGGPGAVADDVWQQLNAPYLNSLRWNAPEGFYIGTAAAGGGHHLDQDYPEPFPGGHRYRELLATEFNSLTPENQMKWDALRPAPDEYNFDPVDQIVEFTEENGQGVRGHALLWHSQNPAWLEEGDFTKKSCAPCSGTTSIPWSAATRDRFTNGTWPTRSSTTTKTRSCDRRTSGSVN